MEQTCKSSVEGDGKTSASNANWLSKIAQLEANVTTHFLLANEKP